MRLKRRTALTTVSTIPVFQLPTTFVGADSRLPLVLKRLEPVSTAEQAKETAAGLAHDPTQAVENPQNERRTTEDEDQHDDQRFNWHDRLPLSRLQHPQIISAKDAKAVVRMDHFMAGSTVRNRSHLLVPAMDAKLIVAMQDFFAF